MKLGNMKINKGIMLFAITLPTLLLLVVAIAPHNLLAQVKSTTTNFLQYQNSTYGIRIQYPSDWQKQENGTKQDTQTDLVTFYASASNTNANLDLSIDDISDEKGISLAQYVNNSLTDLKQSLTNFKLIESSNNNNNHISGFPAYRIVYTSNNGNGATKTLETGTINGSKAYILTYEAGLLEYTKFLPIVQKMIDSFQITK
jgi:eukaryotic-like serine/threonine-protein kinase